MYIRTYQIAKEHPPVPTYLLYIPNYLRTWYVLVIGTSTVGTIPLYHSIRLFVSPHPPPALNTFPQRRLIRPRPRPSIPTTAYVGVLTVRTYLLRYLLVQYCTYFSLMIDVRCVMIRMMRWLGHYFFNSWLSPANEPTHAVLKISWLKIRHGSAQRL